ncbi:MAG: cupin domain-containing protein [Dehalococcoidia bacterium]
MSAGLITINTAKIDWEDDTITKLPKGVQSKLLFHDPKTGRRDMLIRFPDGYVEPRHVHEGAHGVVVLRGQQVAEGVPLNPGDYCYGAANIEHGPFEYHGEDGCVVFAVMVGDPVHKY